MRKTKQQVLTRKDKRMDIFNNKTEIIFTNSNSAIKAKEIAAEVIASMEHNYDYLNGIKNTIKKFNLIDACEGGQYSCLE